MVKKPQKPTKDNPEWTEEMFSESRSMIETMPDVVDAFKRSRGRPPADSTKVHIGMRLDEDIVDWLRSHKGYNSLVNDTLRRKMQSEKNDTK
ncbi:MAG: BrnA antitoxin family protein [Pseudomonadota bacterium]